MTNFNEIYNNLEKFPATKSMEIFAEKLGVDVLTLQMLGCKWSREHFAWAFPMYQGHIISGIKLITDHGLKHYYKDSETGNFVSKGTMNPEVRHVLDFLENKI